MEDGAPALVVALVRIAVADPTVDPPIDPSTGLAVTARPVVETAAASNAEASRPIRRRAGLPRSWIVMPEGIEPLPHCSPIPTNQGAGRTLWGVRFGDPADSLSPVVLRPLLTNGLPCRSCARIGYCGTQAMVGGPQKRKG